MKSNNFLPKVARNATYRASIVVFAVGSIILSSCKKDDLPEPVAVNQSSAKNDSKISAVLTGSGGDGGYFYQSWGILNSGGYLTMNGGPGGKFDVSWGNANDIVCGKGWCTKSNFYQGTPINTATTVKNTQKVGYNIGSMSGDIHFVGVYGWTNNPVIEYYVVEAGPGFGGTGTTTIFVDNHTYTVKKARRPAGAGTPWGGSPAGFDQYFDRWGGATTGVNRNVDMGPHISNWKSKFTNFGTQYEMIFGVEGWGGSAGSTGSIHATMWANN